MQTTILIDSNDAVLSRSDRAAVESAMGQAAGVEIAACCPSGNEDAIRYAMAGGANKLISLEQIEAGLVVCGWGGLGFHGELIAGRLAIRHRAQLVLDVLQFSVNGDRLEVIRKLDRGEKEILMIPFPVVLVMSEASTTRIYLSRYRQASVSLPKMRPVQTATPAIDWAAVRPRSRTTELTNKTGGDAQQRMFAAFSIDNVATGVGSTNDGSILSDPEECAMHLVRYLAHHGFVDPKKFEGRELIQSENQADAQDLRSDPAELTRSKMRFASPRQMEQSLLSVLHRHKPRPVQLTEDAYQAKRNRQPRSIVQSDFVEPLIAATTQARYRRRPRPIHQSERTNQRGPIPLPNRTS